MSLPGTRSEIIPKCREKSLVESVTAAADAAKRAGCSGPVTPHSLAAQLRLGDDPPPCESSRSHATAGTLRYPPHRCPILWVPNASASVDLGGIRQARVLTPFRERPRLAYGAPSGPGSVTLAKSMSVPSRDGNGAVSFPVIPRTCTRPPSPYANLSPYYAKLNRYAPRFSAAAALRARAGSRRRRDSCVRQSEIPGARLRWRHPGLPALARCLACRAGFRGARRSPAGPRQGALL